jgi:metal-responsive CopG/Arc/MetJ family transcriptional regulator
MKFSRFDDGKNRSKQPIPVRLPEDILRDIEEITAKTEKKNRSDVIIALLCFALERYQESADNNLEEMFLMMREIVEIFKEQEKHDELEMRRNLERLNSFVLTRYTTNP